MAISVRIDPLLERELELAAQRKGITKSQFVIDAVERALGRKNPYELMVALQAEEAAAPGYKVERKTATPYDADKSKTALRAKLKAKHGVGRTR
jgi:RHH-type rel operon transcriptional repressor/antitoxin RelB